MKRISRRIMLLMSISLIFMFNLPAFADASKDIPDWLKRIELSGQWESHKNPTFYFETVQPLYQGEDKIDTLFIQPRVSLRSSDLTYNLGVGYRKLVSENLLLGINIFGDYQDLHEHGRIGLGIEALGQVFEARLNSYFGVTPKRIVEDTASSTTYEKVADGLDFELGVPVPYMPWLKVYGSGFWYDFDKFQDKYGWKTRIEATLNKALRLEFYTWDDNKGGEEYGGRLRCHLAFDTLADIRDVFKLAGEPFPKKDLKKRTLIPVERNFDIVVEKWSESAGVTVEIGRGN